MNETLLYLPWVGGYELDFRINLLPQLPYLKSISILLLLGCQYLIFYTNPHRRLR